MRRLYFNEALSKLTIHSHIQPYTLKNAISTIGYSENKEGLYHQKKKMFSLFYYCKSEFIDLKILDSNTILTGPYNKLNKLSDILNQEIPDQAFT